MTPKILLQNLVFAYDLQTLNIESNVSTEIQNLELTEELLQEMPTMEDRAHAIGYQASYAKYQKMISEPSKEDFEKRVNISEFERVCKNIQEKLAVSITLEQLKEFQRIKSLNLTRVAKDRQIS